MSNTIYDEKIWKRLLEKDEKLKQLAIQADVVDKPEKAKRIREAYRHNFGSGKLSQCEKDLAIHLSSTEFLEQSLLHGIVLKGTFAHSVGATEDTTVVSKMFLDYFKEKFAIVMKKCQQIAPDGNISFAKAYSLFLEEIALNLEYKVPFTRLFVLYILGTSTAKEKDRLEIKNYFQENDPIMLPEISQELLVRSYN